MLKIEDNPTSREEKQVDKFTLDELAQQIGNMTHTIDCALKIRGNEHFKQDLQSRALDYKQLLRRRYDFLKETQHV